MLYWTQHAAAYFNLMRGTAIHRGLIEAAATKSGKAFVSFSDVNRFYDSRGCCRKAA